MNKYRFFENLVLHKKILNVIMIIEIVRSDNLFKISDTVVHPGMGVCKITDIKSEDFAKFGSKQFYVMNPIYENTQTTVYVPVDSPKITLKKLLSEEEIEKMLSEIDFSKSVWIENDIIRKEKFSQILKSGDRTDIILLIKELHLKLEEREKTGKRLHIADEKILREAEKLIHQELAFSMNIEIEQVAELIIKYVYK